MPQDRANILGLRSDRWPDVDDDDDDEEEKGQDLWGQSAGGA